MKNRGIFPVLLAALSSILMTDQALSQKADIFVPADYETIQEAVDAAVDGNVIVVSNGIYKGTGDAVVDLKGKQIQLLANASGTYIVGENIRRGFVCTAPDTRMKNSGFPTKISGFTISGCVGAPFDINGDGTIDNGETAGGGIFIDGVDAQIWSCRLWTNEAKAGGGLFVRNGDASIAGCYFLSNSGDLGAGAYIESSEANFFSCTLSENNATKSGGGLYIKNTDDVYIYDVVFDLNTAGISGGGLYLENVVFAFTSYFTNALFTQNTASGDPDGTIPGGGGAWSLHAGSELRARDCELVENRGSEGGAIQSRDSIVELDGCTISYCAAFNGSGGGCLLSNSNLTLVDCKIGNNDAESGGGGAIYAIAGSTLDMTGGGIEGNTATSEGGGIFLSDSSLALSDARIKDNTSGTEGGAIYATNQAGAQLENVELRANSALLGGGGIMLDADARVTITDCTLTSNMATAGVGGAIAIELPGKLTSNQSIFWSNEAVQGGAISNTGTFTPYASVFCSNTPDHIDGAWASNGENCFSFHCQYTSTDGIPNGCICEADLDGDGQINGADLSLLLGSWATAGPMGDLDGNGLVEGADLALMLGSWGGCSNQ